MFCLVRQLEKARSSGTLTLDPATAALLSPEMLLQTPSSETVMVQSDSIGKSEPVLLDRPNNTGDHDDYTIAPKRLKSEPP